MSLLCALSLAALACGHPGTLDDRATLAAISRFNATCHQIAAAISNASEVFYPPSPQYVSDITHTYASSSQASICSVEPGSADDLRIIGSTRTPFAVKSGGHASNPGFSSTRGVQISLARFDKIATNSTAGTVELGPGLTWDQVYTALDPAGVNVIGARIPGVGVAGVTLGGGFSYKSNEYGLSVDNVVSYDLVLPNGTITTVTSNDSDLWFGLRGATNNFGIVTNFVVKSYPQTKVWGGFMFYPPNQLAAVKDAFVGYQRKQDIKASAAVLINYGSGQLLVGSFLFYDAPVPPQGLFDDFLTVPTTSKNLSTTSFADLILLSNQLNPSPGSIRFGRRILLPWTKNSTVGVTLEPFDSGVFSHGSGSAYPPDRSQAVFPSVLGYTWTNASIDGIVASAMRKESTAIHAVALADGQNVSHVAVYDTYGQNLPRLRKIRAAIDPKDVMGLTGGFKF
ncbi:FAD-binding domain-containing protein [Lactarius hatsudake]|nr:FAD-binding domain-containing protein [Lactarius hatsudake]